MKELREDTQSPEQKIRVVKIMLELIKVSDLDLYRQSNPFMDRYCTFIETGEHAHGIKGAMADALLAIPEEEFFAKALRDALVRIIQEKTEA